MFYFLEYKTIKDAIHGYIKIPQPFVDHLIDNEYFQRLRNIEQTGMRVLYPSAKHDRYNHSLGVFHLGALTVDVLLKNIAHNKIMWETNKTENWVKNKILFLIACILHDVGHTPFSHSLEDEIYLKSGNIKINQELHIKIKNFENGVNLDEYELEKMVRANAHEKFSALLILTKLVDYIKALFKEKHLNPGSTYMIIGEQKTVMSQIEILSNKELPIDNNMYYFYLYFSLKKVCSTEIPFEKCVKYLKNAILDFLKDYLKTKNQPT
jgi:HD superfamily phosphohydrolase